MKILWSNTEKTLILSPIIAFLLIYSSIVVVAQYGSTPLSQLATQDPLQVGEIEMLSNGEYRFQLMSGNQSVGTINTPYSVQEGQPVAILNLMDSVNIPVLYEAREWSDVYAGEKRVVSGEQKTLSYFAGALWLLPLGGLVISKIVGKKKN